MTCLADSQLPVRVQAAAALGALIEHDDVHAAMAPNAGRLMQELLKLSDETDLDVLSGTTSKIVDSFSEELLPFSVQFCTHLRDTYMRLLNEHLAGANVEEDPDQIDFNQNQEDKRASASPLRAVCALLTTVTQSLRPWLRCRPCTRCSRRPRASRRCRPSWSRSSCRSWPTRWRRSVSVRSPLAHHAAFAHSSLCLADLYDDCLDLTDMLTFNQKRCV